MDGVGHCFCGYPCACANAVSVSFRTCLHTSQAGGVFCDNCDFQFGRGQATDCVECTGSRLLCGYCFLQFGERIPFVCKNQNQKLNYTCKCGTPYSTSYKHFKRGQRCNNCAHLHRRASKLKPLEEVRSLLASRGCTLLPSSYRGSSSPLTYRCACGCIRRGCMADILSTQGCRVCFGRRNRHSYQRVRTIFQNRECELLSSSYGGVSRVLKFRCKCGEIRHASFTTFRKNGGCFSCSKAQQIANCMKKYGVPHPMQNPTFLAQHTKKFTATSMKNYGVSHPMQSNAVKDKHTATLMKNYGVPHPLQNIAIKEKAATTLMKNYGVRFPLQSAIIRSKATATLMKNYGVEHPSQHAGLQQKAMGSAFRRRIFTLNGKSFSLMGYEHFCVRDLVQEGYSVEEFTTSLADMPLIRYEHNGTYHTYFPDVFLPRENILIEVKSTYFLEKTIETTFLKLRAAVALGYNMQLRVYARSGELLHKYDSSVNMKEEDLKSFTADTTLGKRKRSSSSS